MPDQLFEGIVEQSLAQVLETMFFTSVAGEGGEGAVDDLVRAKVTFTGQPSGWLSLGVSREAASEMAENFLGLDGPAQEAQATEVVLELANMVCGTMLSRAESDTHFELSEPALIDGPPNGARRRIFELEHGVVEVCLDTSEADGSEERDAVDERIITAS